MGLPLGGDENFLELVGIDAQLCEYTESLLTVY